VSDEEFAESKDKGRHGKSSVVLTGLFASTLMFSNMDSHCPKLAIPSFLGHTFAPYTFGFAAKLDVERSQVQGKNRVCGTSSHVSLRLDTPGSKDEHLAGGLHEQEAMVRPS
jgi:hypothetical protein